MEKMNFSGGEPFLQERGRFVGELTRFCKQDLQLPSVSIVSNGSLITQKWFREYGMPGVQFIKSTFWYSYLNRFKQDDNCNFSSSTLP